MKGDSFYGIYFAAKLFPHEYVSELTDMSFPDIVKDNQRLLLFYHVQLELSIVLYCNR